ncbi:MAG: hypothetical protein ACRCUM_01370 [Mycoplasmoidaceae bacterium]
MRRIKTLTALDKHTIHTYETALQKLEEDFINRVHRLNISELGRAYAVAVEKELNLLPQANEVMNTKEVIDYSKAKKVVKTKKVK